MKKTTDTLTIEIVKLHASNGRYIRKATKVTRGDGKSITFMELLPKYIARQQAAAATERDWT